MKFKSFLGALVPLLVLTLITVVTASAQGNLADLTIINFVGGEMIFTLDGTAYTVPGTASAPEGGRLTLSLASGRHTYSAHVPGSEGINGEVDLAAGEKRALGARLDETAAVISPSGEVLEEPGTQLVFFEASLAPAGPTPTPQPAPLQPLPAGQGALVLINYIGEGLNVDINGVVYTVPPNGRLQVNLPPGQVNYSANAGLSGTSGSAQVTAGQYTGLGFTREVPSEQPDFQAGEPAPTPVPLDMSVISVPLEGETAAQAIATPSPAASPAPAASPSPPASPSPVPAGEGELIVTNYNGETLTFTINNQENAVAGNGGVLTLRLAPGEYTFTAATIRGGTNGTLRLTGGTTTRMSVALDVPSGAMQVYLE